MRLYAKATYRPRMSSGQFMDAVITPGARASVQAVTQRIYDISQGLVHVDSGDLKASGEIVIDDSGKTIVGTVRYTSDHAIYNEFGTGQRGAASGIPGGGPYNPEWPGMAAIPFLRPAYDEVRPLALGMFRSEIATQFKAAA